MRVNSHSPWLQISLDDKKSVAHETGFIVIRQIKTEFYQTYGYYI